MAETLHQKIRKIYPLPMPSHMTHIKKLESIINSGGLLPFNKVQHSEETSLSNEDVQKGRASKTVPPSGRPLHDYVPLYFSPKTPMVAWNQAKNEDIIFLRFLYNIFKIEGVVFTDGNARSNSTQFYNFTSVDDLKALDLEVVCGGGYKDDPERKRKKQAEILVPDFLPFSEVYDIFVFSQSTQIAVLQTLSTHGIKTPIRVSPKWYFRPQT